MASSVGDKQGTSSSGTDDQIDSNGPVSVRTLCVHGITPLMIDKINSHFVQFGKIQSVSMQFEDSRTRWCLVQFKRREDAEEALLRTRNRWYGCDVQAADSWHQPDHPLQVAPEQDSDSNISVALNDDCLQEIFKLLKPSSLTNVAGVCKRFNQQAKITFALKHKHLDLTELVNYQSDFTTIAMKLFGKDIQSLIIDASLFTKEVDAIRMIGQFCGPKLNQLELRNFRFQPDSLSLRPIFSQIDQLKLDRCASSTCLVELMAGCGKLKSLSLSFCDLEVNQNILSRTFSKLQEFSLSCNGFNDDNFEGFVTRHPTLIKLSFESKRFTPRLFHTIGHHARNLQELKLFWILESVGGNVQFQNEAACIGQLSSLKKLQLYFKYHSIIPVLDALIAREVPIEKLNVGFTAHVDFDRAIKCISQLKRIKMLQISTPSRTRRVADEDIVELAECLPELEELHLNEFHWCSRFESQLSTVGLRQMLMGANKLKLLKLRSIGSIKIDVDDYNAMLSTVQEREEKVPLLIEIDGPANQIKVLAVVLAKNRSALKIIISKH